MNRNGLRIEALGWSSAWEEKFRPFLGQGCAPGRVAVEDRGRYVVFAEQGELAAQVTGRLMAAAGAPADFPKVGDWVALTPLPGEEKAVIQGILPRSTQLARKVAGREVEEQVLVTNVDCAFIVQALDASFNPRLLQRYLAMVTEGGVVPVILLNKVDLKDHVGERHAEAERISGEHRVLEVSARTGLGLGSLRAIVQPGLTAVFVGTSGVGKSSLINRLFGESIQATAEVREHDAKGRHTTSWRELIVLPQGGLVIDTPGMREFHLWMAGENVHEAFPDIERLALGCKFTDCTHLSEPGCAIRKEVEAGRLSADRLAQFQKLRRELAFLEEARRLAPAVRRRPGHVVHRRFMHARPTDRRFPTEQPLDEEDSP